MRYRRPNTAGGTYFFTVNPAERSADTLVRHIDDLREVTRRVKETHPFSIVALNEHFEPISDAAIVALVRVGWAE